MYIRGVQTRGVEKDREVTRSPGGARWSGDSLPGLLATHPPPTLQIFSETEMSLKLLLP